MAEPNSPDSPDDLISFEEFNEVELVTRKVEQVELLKSFPSNLDSTNGSDENREPVATSKSPKAPLNANPPLVSTTSAKPNVDENSTNGLDIKARFESSSFKELCWGPITGGQHKYRITQKNIELINSRQTSTEAGSSQSVPEKDAVSPEDEEDSSEESELISPEYSSPDLVSPSPFKDQKGCLHHCSCKSFAAEELLEELKLIKNQLILMVERVTKIEETCVSYN